jgi:hypothetical protein
MRLSDQDKYFDYLTHPEVQKFLSDEDIPDTSRDVKIPEMRHVSESR